MKSVTVAVGQSDWTHGGRFNALALAKINTVTKAIFMAT